METPSDLNAKRESRYSNTQVSEPFALTDDGMRALAGCLERARQMIDAGTTASQIQKKDLDFLKGLTRFCANSVREDLGPATPNFLKERYDYLQSELASLRRSFDTLMDFARIAGS